MMTKGREINPARGTKGVAVDRPQALDGLVEIEAPMPLHPMSFRVTLA
jgi:hypothetical protein